MRQPRRDVIEGHEAIDARGHVRQARRERRPGTVRQGDDVDEVGRAVRPQGRDERGRAGVRRRRREGRAGARD